MRVKAWNSKVAHSYHRAYFREIGEALACRDVSASQRERARERERERERERVGRGICFGRNREK